MAGVSKAALALMLALCLLLSVALCDETPTDIDPPPQDPADDWYDDDPPAYVETNLWFIPSALNADSNGSVWHIPDANGTASAAFEWDELPDGAYHILTLTQGRTERETVVGSTGSAVIDLTGFNVYSEMTLSLSVYNSKNALIGQDTLFFQFDRPTAAATQKPQTNMPQSAAATTDESNAVSRYQLVPGTPMTMYHTDGNGALTPYGGLALKLPRQADTCLVLDGQSLPLACSAPFTTDLDADQLVLSSSADAPAWRISGAALTTLARSGITALALQSNDTSCVLSTAPQLEGYAYTRLRSQGYPLSRFLWLIDGSRVRVEADDHTYVLIGSELIPEE